MHSIYLFLINCYLFLLLVIVNQFFLFYEKPTIIKQLKQLKKNLLNHSNFALR